MQVGSASVSFGGGTAVLTLPDVPSFISLAATTNPSSVQTGTFELSDGFDEEIGGGLTGSIEIPASGAAGSRMSVVLGGFWSAIEGKTTSTCFDGDLSNLCMLAPLVDNPNAVQRSITGAIGETITSSATRDVDQWGASLQAMWQLAPAVSGVTRAPARRYLAIGADVRGIAQDLDVGIVYTRPGYTPATYREDLDTTYYGVTAAWGRDYTLPLFGRAVRGIGLQSSFLLRGGVYYAETEYDGSLVDGTAPLQQATSALSLSRDEVAFIGGVVLETKKRIGRRATLSLTSAYEYYSYVPAMAYNEVDVAAGGTHAIGGQRGTVIGEDDAFSARSMLRLTIGLGPSVLYE